MIVNIGVSAYISIKTVRRRKKLNAMKICYEAQLKDAEIALAEAKELRTAKGKEKQARIA